MFMEPNNLRLGDHVSNPNYITIVNLTIVEFSDFPSSKVIYTLIKLENINGKSVLVNNLMCISSVEKLII